MPCWVRRWIFPYPMPIHSCRSLVSYLLVWECLDCLLMNIKEGEPPVPCIDPSYTCIGHGAYCDSPYSQPMPPTRTSRINIPNPRSAVDQPPSPPERPRSQFTPPHHPLLNLTPPPNLHLPRSPLRNPSQHNPLKLPLSPLFH